MDIFCQIYSSNKGNSSNSYLSRNLSPIRDSGHPRFPLLHSFAYGRGYWGSQIFCYILWSHICFQIQCRHLLLNQVFLYRYLAVSYNYNYFRTAERRRNSRQLEFLFTYYVRMLNRNRMELKISKLWESIVKGLQLYPFNPYLHYALVEISHLYTSPNKLRWTFDDHCRKYNLFIIMFYILIFLIHFFSTRS